MSFDVKKTTEEIIQWIRDWFEENGKLYFMPNWGMGDPMTFYETTQVEELGENCWEISASAEYECSSSCVVVYDEESGRYLIDQ